MSVVRKKAEEGVIRCLIEDTGLSHWGKENLTPDDFADLRCREAYMALRRGPFGSIEDEKLLGWLAELCARFGPVGQPERILRDCLRKLKELRLAELRDRIAVMEREKNEDALSEVRREYQSLLKQVKSVGEAGGSSSSPVSPRREGS